MINTKIMDNLHQYSEEFNSAAPFKSLCIENFFTNDTALNLLNDFPNFENKYAINEYGKVGGKAVVSDISTISPFYKKFYEYINSTSFLSAMSSLTGIPDLIPDKELYGAGTHENVHGQNLDVHVDFNYSEKGKLHRRLNLLVYLNEEWDETWGGSIELHSNPRDPKNDTKASFLPLMNRAVVFETTEHSWHGFEEIKLPQEKQHLSRKCISIYLYTKDRPENEIAPTHGTFYVQYPLPKHIKTGFTIDKEADLIIKKAITKRDTAIAMYQEKEKELNGIIEQLQQHNHEIHEKIRVPCTGYIKQEKKAEGFYFDSWMSKKMCIDLTPTKTVTALSLTAYVPPQLNPEITLTASINEEVTDTHTHAEGGFTWTFQPKKPLDKAFTLCIEASSTFNPKETSDSSDDRTLSIVIISLESSHEY